MSHPFRKSIAWFLIVALAIVSGFGEGLHYIPGCGHGTPVGSRFFLLGIGRSVAERLADCCRNARSDGSDIPIYDEDLCAICSVIGHKTAMADAVCLILVVPFVHALPAAAFPDAPAAEVHCFQARAPPSV